MDEETSLEISVRFAVLEAIQNCIVGVLMKSEDEPLALADNIRYRCANGAPPDHALMVELERRLASIDRVAQAEIQRRVG